VKINLKSLGNTKLIILGLSLVVISFCCGGGIIGLVVSSPNTEQIETITKVVEVTKLYPSPVYLSPTPYPTYTKYPTFTPVPMTSTPSAFVEQYRFAGSGKGTTETFGLSKGILKISWQYIGDSNYILYLWDLSTSEKELLSNSIGSVEASALLPVAGGSDYMFEVLEGTGTWEIIVEYKP